MKKYLSMFAFALVAMSMTLTSCGDDDDDNADTKKPTITITTPKVAAPATTVDYNPGDKIEVVGKVEDDVKLKSLEITLTKQEGAADATWKPTFDKLTLSGTKKEWLATEKLDVFEEAIPANASLGKYDLKFTLTDDADNKAEHTVVIEIKAASTNS